VPRTTPLLSLENLPQVWRAPELARAAERVVATGHGPLDEQLPGGGWPCGSLVEILQSRPGRHAWQLLLPALAQATREEGGPVVLVNAPHLPFGPALKAQGLAPERLLRVNASSAPRALWASEQALRCADVVALMAWLPRCRGAELRRLQLAAAQQQKLLFVFRGLDVRGESSPARVRLEIEESDALRVHLLKRRGPPLATAIELPSHPMRLQHLLDSRRRAAPVPPTRSRSHGLDRTVALA
jgi:protein ImuA